MKFGGTPAKKPRKPSIRPPKGPTPSKEDGERSGPPSTTTSETVSQSRIAEVANLKTQLAVLSRKDITVWCLNHPTDADAILLNKHGHSYWGIIESTVAVIKKKVLGGTP